MNQITHKNYSIKDFSLANSDLTLVLESPHKTEILLGYPAAGETGNIISNVIFNRKDPIGGLLQENHALSPRTSILNACTFPLQNIYSIPLCDDLNKIISARNHESRHIPSAKDNFKEVLRNNIGQQITTDFRIRFTAHLAQNKKSKFIICGLIAQCIFEEATNLKGWYHEVNHITFNNINFSVFYENHPAAINDTTSKWHDIENIKPMLDYISN